MIGVEQVMAVASPALERQGARLVDFNEGEVTVESGMGLGKQRVVARLGELMAWLEAHPGAETTRPGIASFFRGVGSVVVAPRPNRRELGFSFTDAAGRLFPSIEGPLFGMGAQEALKEPAFLWDAAPGLQTAFFLELDTGRKVLTARQVTEWGVSPNRVERAAVSMLFHRTHDMEPKPLPSADLPSGRLYKTGDGYDSARALLLDAVFFQTINDLRFSMPSPEMLLLIESTSPLDVAALRRETARLSAESAWPLSSNVYAWSHDRLTPIE